MTAPSRPLSGFIEKIALLKQLRLQEQAQRLDERARGATMIDLFRKLAAVSPIEARPSLVKLFADQTGLDPELLTGAAEGPESVGIITERKLAAGAGVVPNEAVASVGLTGQLPGAVAADADFGEQLANMTPAQRQIYFNKRTTGLPVETGNLPRAGAVAAGLESSADARLSADVGISNIKSDEMIAAGQQALQLAIANLQASAEAGDNPSAFGDLIGRAQKSIEELSKGGLDKFTQNLHVAFIREILAKLGLPADKLLPAGTAIDPTMLQELSRKVPWLGAGQKGFEGLPPAPATPR